MKFKKIIFSLILFSFSICLKAQNNSALIDLENIKNPTYNEIVNSYNDYWKNVPISERKGWKQFQRWQYFWKNRLMPDGSFPNANYIQKELNAFQNKNKKEKNLAAKDWTLLGPTKIVSNEDQTGLGRINVVRFQPGSTKIMYVGTAGGGLWKTSNGGSTWVNEPFFDFLSIGISDIAVSPSNPNIIYVATGDADGLGSSQAAYSVGIVKSTDGGVTWKNTGFSYTLGKYIVARILVHPTNPEIVLAGTNTGIFRSTDGGTNFTLQTSGIYIKDMEFSYDDPNVIIAASYGWGGNNAIYRSSDNGINWKSVKSLTSCVRIALAASSSNSEYIYALAASVNRGFHSLLLSTDRGQTWVTKSNSSSSPNILGWYDGTDLSKGQGEYDLALTVSPGNEFEIYTGGVNAWKSTNSGTSWIQITHWYGGFNKPFVHADFHDIQFNEESGFLYATHDGGIDYSSNSGATWLPLMNGLSITQFYKLSTAQTKDQYILAGAQDNGTFKYEDGNWYFANGGDGMDCLVDYSDHRRSYVSTYNGSFKKTATGSSWSYMISENKTGENGAWVTPIAINPINPNNIYVGFQSVWRSSDYGYNWVKYSNFSNSNTLTILATAPSDTNIFYAGYSNAIWATYDNGKTWKSLTNSLSLSNISGITVDYNDPKRIYVSIGGFSDGTKVFTYDGTTWMNLSGNLPNIPANCIILQKNSPQRLYVGTDAGVYFSDYNSGIWINYGENTKNIVFTDLEIQTNIKKLRAATYGRGIWEIDLIDCNLPAPSIKANGSTSFCFGDSVELEVVSELNAYTWSNGQTGKKIWIKESGVYSVYYQDPSGCIARSQGIQVVVTVPPNLAISTTGNAKLCEGGSLDLNASFGFVTYEWSNGGTARKTTITTPGKYWVKGFTKDGCSIVSKVFEVNQNPLPAKPLISRYNYKQLISSEALTYQWYCNDTLLAGQTNRICDIVKLGKFTVTISDSNGCKNTSEYQDVISEVNDFNATEYCNITPNPTNGITELNMNLFSNGNYLIRITNNIGKIIEIKDGFYSGGIYHLKIDLSNYINGLYYIEVKCGDSVFKEKIIKF